MMNKKSDKTQKNDHFTVAEQYLPNVIKTIGRLDEFQQFLRIRKRFIEKVENLGAIPFDPRFNSVLWAYDLINLLFEIIHGFVWMKAWADFYKKEVPEGSQPSNSFLQLSFYGSTCITLIDSIRDKAALLVWAHYIPFNPDKKNDILIYEEILKNLKNPRKFNFKISGHQVFLTLLNKLKGNNFKEVEKFRHLKIHRREPRIELYHAGPHLEILSCLPLNTPELIQKWDEILMETYPNDAAFRDRIRKQCHIKGKPFGSFKTKNIVWEYGKLEKHIFNCLKLLLECTSGSLAVLCRRKPLRKTA